METRKKNILILVAITLLGIALRIHNLSDYKFYPDSYVPLIVAENINTFGSVIGTLGENGMLYPDFFGWTRPLFPYLIYLLNLMIGNLFLSGQIITMLAGIATIPLSYFYIKSVLNSKTAGLFASLLLALSYSHVVWGGFILSETTGVVFLILFLWIFFKNLERESSLADWRDFLSGATFALAVLARYEYAILVLPVAFMFFLKLKEGKPVFARILNMIVAGSFLFALTYFYLSPFTLQFSNAGKEIGSLFGFFNSHGLNGIKKFVLSDILLSIFGFLGLCYMF
ncbi:MAG: glycosyltransferase family 39 protein, partial [bacterium]|nr:glycosyltransferase family 39 protein [bacterium]